MAYANTPILYVGGHLELLYGKCLAKVCFLLWDLLNNMQATTVVCAD